jgi:PAS domain S-box-containing protein
VSAEQSSDHSDELRNRLAAIVQSSDDAIISKSLDGIIQTWNRGAEQIFGYLAEEAIGQSITLIIPSNRIEEEMGILARLRKGERIDHFQTVRRRKDGALIDISLTVSPIRSASGVIIGASKCAREITAQKRAEAALHRAEAEREELLAAERHARGEAERMGRLKDEFLATLSHELRTPLNTILGWSTLLRRMKPGSADYSKGLETIERNARAQSQIIGDLLEMSRIISGKVQLDVQPVNLNEIIEASLDVIRPSVEAKKIRVRTVLDAKVGRIRGDYNRLQQVLWNLLTNAVKFTPSHGRIDVVMERVNSHVEISVEDSGVGIKPEFLPFVFDRFRQADASTTRTHGGLGLGLSIVKHLLELHGGTARVKSPGEGKGSTFIVTLPISAIHNSEEALPERSSLEDIDVGAVELPQLRGARTLVVDDEADARYLIARIIEEAGGAAVIASSAEDALHRLGTEPVDILISDIGMPQMDGYQLIQRVRKLDQPRLAKIAAIALTAYARADDRQRALLMGYQMHLAKPVDPRELIAGIASLLNIAGGRD